MYWSNLEDSKNDDKPYILIKEFDSKALKNYGIKLESGRLPKNSDEIVISNAIIKNGRVNYKVGDTLNLKLGNRVNAKGEIIENNIPYTYSEGKLTTETTKTYTIVGIIKRPNYSIESFNCAGYSAITLLDEEQDNTSISVLYSNYKDYVKDNLEVDQIAQTFGKEKFEKVLNSDLLRFNGALSESLMKLLLGIAAVVVTIIVVTSVFVIRNSFAISIYERNRQYGMLSSIGATSKQIKTNVLFEGLIIGLIGIPLGIFLGMAAVYILMQVLNILLSSALQDITFVYSVPLIPIVISIIISGITIFLSCLIPAIKASKISPIEAIRGNEDINIKKKKIKSPKIIKKIFGIGGVIADKNLKRSRKKYRTTVISLVTSIVIFITMSSFMTYGNKSSTMYYSKVNFDLDVNSTSEETYKSIAKLDNVNTYGYSFVSEQKVDYEKNATNTTKDVFKDNKDELRPRVEAYNNEYFKDFIKSLGIDPKEYKTTVILIDESLIREESGKKTLYNLYNVKEGDTLSLKDDDNKTYNYKITKRTDARPIGYEGSFISAGLIVVAKDYVDDISKFSLKDMFIASDKPDELENKINDLSKTNELYENVRVDNYATMAQQMNNMILAIGIFLYGFISVITLIGVTNIFNTITTNMILRSKEFAMLKSIGMTSKEFNKMIRLESILYGLKSLLIGIPIGLIGSYFIYDSFAKSLDLGYIFPVNAIIISIVSVFIIVGLTMKYSLNKINKQNIIETIRKENT